MIMTLALVIAMVAVMTGSFLSLGQQQLTTQRTIDRIRLYWAAEAVIDKSQWMFYFYTRANGFPPITESGRLVYDDTGTVVSRVNDRFQTRLAEWFSGPFKALWGNEVFMKHLSLDDVTVTADSSTLTDVYKRIYEIRVRVSNPLSGSVSEYLQTISVGTGTLFDFGVFYNDDLEIAPGLNWELQGPVFSNGNVYLMNGKGTTLTFKMPNDVSYPEYYALRSAGNIYFYFKTTLAPNYLLENSYYRDAVQESIYRTDLATHPLNSADYSSGAPFRGVEVYPSPHLLTTLNYTSAPPLLYTFSNGLEYGGISSHTIKVKKITGAVAEYFDFLSASKPSTPMTFTDHRLRNAPYLGYAKDYTPDKKVSISTAFDRSDRSGVRKLHKEWTPENPVSDPPFVNPYWNGFPGEGHGLWIADRKQGVTRKALPLGDGRLDTHVLIEPLDGRESPLVAKYKFETYANIRFVCSVDDSDGSCKDGSYQLKIKDPAGGSWKTKDLSTGVIADWPNSGLEFRTFYDYRLGAAVRLLDIDVHRFLGAITSEEGIAFSSEHRPSIYIRTESPDTWRDGKPAPVAVRIRNGAELPAAGLSVVTNGRLWVLGDYNVTDPETGQRCAFADIANPDSSCRPPSADLYSDSFGVLSNNWNMGIEDAGRNLINTTTKLIADRTRVLKEDVILNAAVITGFLRSQLVKAVPTPWPGGDTNPETIELCATRPGAVALKPINLAQCASDPDTIPCLYGAPTICYSPDGFHWEDIERDSRGIWNLKRTGNYYQELKAKNNMMVNSPQFNALLATNHPAPQSVSTTTIAMTKLLGAADYVETSRVENPGAVLDVSVHRMPQEYFDPVDPKPLPIVETRGTDTVSDGPVWDQRFYWEESPDRPFAGSNYPGVYWRKLWKSAGPDYPVHYTCIKNSEVKNYYVQSKSCLTTPGGDVVPDTCTTQTHWTGLTETKAKCRCDDAVNVYTNPQATLSNPHVTGIPGGEPQDFDRHPEDWTNPAGFLGSGICPEEADNYFSSYPKIYYAWRAYGALWEPRYSGGLENTINLQEAWYDDRGTQDVRDDLKFALHFSGNIVAIWDSKQLVKTTGEPAFYGTTYYLAPIRDYDFNENLRANPPPLPDSSGMSLFSVSRKRFRELDPKTGKPYGVQEETVS